LAAASDDRLLAALDLAVRSLDNVCEISEAKLWRDDLATLQGHLKRRQSGHALRNKGMVAVVLAERRIGQLFNDDPPPVGRPPKLEDRLRISDIGVSAFTVRRWRKFALVSPAEIGQLAADKTACGMDFTRSTVWTEVTKRERKGERPRDRRPTYQRVGQGKSMTPWEDWTGFEAKHQSYAARAALFRWLAPAFVPHPGAQSPLAEAVAVLVNDATGSFTALDRERLATLNREWFSTLSQLP
jgi:hypothetical protein